MSTLKLRAKGDSVRLLQELLNKTGYNLIVDGIFGKGTGKAVIDFQKKNNLVADGIVGTKTWTVLHNISSNTFEEIEEKFLAEKDLIALSNSLGVELAAVKAVYEIESSGRGFLTDGRPKILFEGHIFWKQLKNKGLNPEDFREDNGDVLYPKWTKQYYKGGSAEHDRLNKAKLINEDAALESASWGIFQIMGFHYKKVGYDSVKLYVKAMYKSEAYHLKAFGKFIESENLVRHLRNHNWAAFARGYNGAGYKQNKYDIKLERAFRKYSG